MARESRGHDPIARGGSHARRSPSRGGRRPSFDQRESEHREQNHPVVSAGLLVEIEDSCGGLPAGAPEKLLQPFVQKGHDRTGLGLGLAICWKAVKAMAGELRIRDVPGKGCVFTIDLPRSGH